MTSSLRVRFGAVSPPGIVDRATRSTGAACGTLAALVGLRAAVYFLLGPGLILDDWTAAGNREFQGVLSIADSGRLMSRPVEWLTYTLIYGVAGSSAKWLLVLTTLLNVAAVCALFVAFRRFYSPRTSVIICAAWILVPNHNSMTAWAANTQSVVAFTLLCLGIYALSRGWATAAACCLAGAVLGYQLTIPPAVLATLFIGTRFVPLAAETPSPTQPLTLFRRAAVMAAILLGVAWTTIEPTYPLRVAGPRPWVYVSAHFGEGLFASSGAVTILALLFVVTAAGGIVTALYLYWQGDRDRERGPALVVVGLIIMASGGLGTVLSGSQAYGMTDRLYAVSSVGAVMVWVGIARILFASRRLIGGSLVAAWCICCVYGQSVSLTSWSRAGEDVPALLAYIDETVVDRDARIVVGPRAVRRNNIVGIVSPHAPDNALWLHRGRTAGSLRIAKTPDEFVVQEPGEVLLRWTGD